MKTMMRRTISAVSALILAAATAGYAQNGINSTVEVKRDYEGSVAKAVKSQLYAPVDDSLLNFKLNFDYTTFYNPYKDLYEFSPIMTVGPASEGRVVYPWLYARLAASFPLAPSADLYVTPRLSEKFSFGIYANHDSFWGRLPQVRFAGGNAVADGQKISGSRMKNKAGADFGFRWKKGELRLGASYAAGRYALASAEGVYPAVRFNTFDHLNSVLTVRSTNPDPSSFYYDLNLGYRYFGNRMSIVDHLVDADLSLGAAIKSEHKVYLRFSGTFSDYGVWKIAPVYRWERDRWRVNAGVTFSSAYGGISDGFSGIIRNSNRFLVYPDASVDFEAARNALWLYLKAYGENKLHTLYDLFAINPWMDNSDSPQLASVPIAAELGLKGQVRDRFSYTLGLNYSYARNMLSFMSQQQGQHMYQILAGGETHVFTASGVLRWKSMDFFALAEVNYRGFSNPDAALMMPALDLSAVLEYNLRQRLFIRADCYFRTSTEGKAFTASSQQALTYRVPAFVDVGLRVSYAFNTRVMAFVEGNNLANSRLQYFLGYVEPGINIGAGICLKL